MELLVERGVGHGGASGEGDGPATGHVSRPPGGSGCVNNTIMGGEASFVVQSGVISGGVHVPVTVHRVLPGLVARQLPPATELVGRARELDVLRDILCAESFPTGTVVVSAVAGMAGVGKTAFAVKAAHGALRGIWCPGRGSPQG